MRPLSSVFTDSLGAPASPFCFASDRVFRLRDRPPLAVFFAIAALWANADRLPSDRPAASSTFTCRGQLDPKRRAVAFAGFHVDRSGGLLHEIATDGEGAVVVKMGGMDGVPWDIYIDERKAPAWSLGFLVVPNTASFMHKLYRGRHVPNAQGQAEFRGRELHWNEPRGDLIDVGEAWINTVFQHRYAKFYLCAWPRGEAKELVVLRFLADFCRSRKLVKPFNVVAILAFDSEHAKVRIQNTIRQTGGILRCYHLDSRNNDCLQCCDLMIGATTLLNDDPTVCLGLDQLLRQRQAGQRLTDAQIKRYWAGHLGKMIDRAPPNVYDLR